VHSHFGKKKSSKEKAGGFEKFRDEQKQRKKRAKEYGCVWGAAMVAALAFWGEFDGGAGGGRL
jgi:hypothetical protein